jgi:hypothetical protein
LIKESSPLHDPLHVGPSGCYLRLYMLNNDYQYKLSEGALQGVAEALRLVAKLPGLGREASLSAAADSMEFFISTYIEKERIKKTDAH